MPGVAGGIIPVFSRKPAGTSSRILEKYRMPDPADELKRRICRVFSFPGLPPEILGSANLSGRTGNVSRGAGNVAGALKTFEAL
jgi:hypothetical protein